MERNIKIYRFGIYYVPRKILEDYIPNKIKALKKKRSKLLKNGCDTTEVNKLLIDLESKRPCLVLKNYKGNVTLMPITKSDADESHFETKAFKNNNFKSYIKTSVIVTISYTRFIEIMQRNGNIRIPSDEIESFLDVVKKHYIN